MSAMAPMGGQTMPDLVATAIALVWLDWRMTAPLPPVRIGSFGLNPKPQRLQNFLINVCAFGMVVVLVTMVALGLLLGLLVTLLVLWIYCWIGLYVLIRALRPQWRRSAFDAYPRRRSGKTQGSG